MIIMIGKVGMLPGGDEPDLGIHLSFCKVEYGPCKYVALSRSAKLLRGQKYEISMLLCCPLPQQR